ncbi:FKBP-type peptidyl-prolyl cis-trans isomerase [Nonomuraea sp. NPDC050328]|uniref:FKBP-type peptidyl-prolyl cis-trans isomerase n=1 Tax=Nonomuraea sp. NPDC050328 TaxID=3364361 RepID=UPI0037889605
MRRRGPVIVVLLLVLAACAASPPAGELRVSGAFGAVPTVVFPSGGPAGQARSGLVSEGYGRPVAAGETAIVHFTAHTWDELGARVADSSFRRGVPAVFPLGELLPGLEAALLGRRVGSRVTALIPAAEAAAVTSAGATPTAGSTGSTEGAEDDDATLRPGPELFYVIDILGVHGPGETVIGAPGGRLGGVTVAPGTPPELSIPAAPAPGFATAVLGRGSGPRVEAGQLVVTHYSGAVWRDGRPFESTWTRSRPKAVTIGVGNVIAGWDRALLGVPVGSRVLVIVPPALGYGAAGLPAQGVRGDDTLVFVMDVLAAY